MCATDENEANLSEHITTTVEQYFTLNLWEKLWWRLTKPISHYMMLNDILTLNQMKEALDEDSVSKSVVIYNQLALFNGCFCFECGHQVQKEHYNKFTDLHERTI